MLKRIEQNVATLQGVYFSDLGDIEHAGLWSEEKVKYSWEL